MGLLVEGKWQNDWYDTKSTDGKFIRENSKFRNWVTVDDHPGPSGKGGFKAETNRYHLYVSLACPWAHRTLIFRKLKGLDQLISVSVVNSFMGEFGWTFDQGDGVIPDTVNHKKFLHEIYTLATPNYTGRVTVPVLWDKKLNTIVSNESADIIRMFNSAFDHLGATVGDYYPLDKRNEIDEVNQLVYHNINNGVYKAGFATSQTAYDDAVTNLFRTLDKIELLLTSQKYLVGNKLTEADWRLFTTLLRFDSVYVGLFKCNLKPINEYPALSNYLRELYQFPGIVDTINLDYIKANYYKSLEAVNPTRVIPIGPTVDFCQPHNRNRFD